MELMLRRTSTILNWAGFILLLIALLSMLILGFMGSMSAVAYLIIQDGGNASPIFTIIHIVIGLWQLSTILFLLSLLFWAFYKVARSGRKRKEYEQDQMIDQIKREVTEERAVTYLDLTNPIKKKRKSR